MLSEDKMQLGSEHPRRIKVHGGRGSFPWRMLMLLPLLLSGCTLTGANDSGNVQIGARLFVADRCISCHQVNGMGGTDAPDLSHNITATQYELLKHFLIDDPPNAMAYVKQFHVTPGQIRDLASFTNNNESLMPQGSSPAAIGRPPVGAQLFVTYGCINCHQVNGVGGTDSPDLTHDPSATNYDIMKSELEVPPPAMAYLKKYHFTAQQIADLAAFSDSDLKPQAKHK
jgi:mono/diheme cytochrome c family protein